MYKITLIPSFKKKGFVFSFLLISSFFILENAFSIKHWKPDYITISYVPGIKLVVLNFTFFDLNRSEENGNGYLEWCKFEYTTDGEDYKTFMRAETNNQMPIENIFNTKLWVTLTHKLNGSNIYIEGYVLKKNGLIWDDSTIQHVAVFTFNDMGILELKLQLEKIKNIRVTGKWTVMGLICPDYFSEIYNVTPPDSQ